MFEDLPEGIFFFGGPICVHNKEPIPSHVWVLTPKISFHIDKKELFYFILFYFSILKLHIFSSSTII